MNNLFYKELISSFHEMERKDFNAICNIIDNQTVGYEIAVISNDPYLLTLIFTSLIRRYGIQIHILNPMEDVDELQRLLYVINPTYIIMTDSVLKEELHNYRKLLIDGNTISKEDEEDVNTPEEIDFTIINYTPSPTKIYRLSSEMFIAMVNGFIQDLAKFKLTSWMDYGLIPFVEHNSDYLFYYVAIKMSNTVLDNHKSLPTAEEDGFVMNNRDRYLKLCKSKTLFITKKKLFEAWETEIVSMFENRFIFKSFMKRKWLVNILMRKRFKKLFKGFKNVLIIGVLDNTYIIDILKNLSFVKFYSIIPIESAMMFGAISQSLDTTILSSNEFRQDTLTNFDQLYMFSFKLFHPDNEIVYNIIDIYNRFIEGKTTTENGYDHKQYHLLGSSENSFNDIFPETLEKIINSYPFIRKCALLNFNDKVILIIDPNMNILDSNKINYKMFDSIIQKQIDTLNKELPESYKIQGFVVSTSLIEQNRNGNIVRFPFNYCKKRSG